MLAQIRSFLAVIEETSLNRAAARLRISQPALSRQMQALENEIGGKLLERTSSGIQATDAGFAFAKRMKPLLAEYDVAMAEARRFARGEKEQLRIGYLASAAREYLTPALQALKKAYPKVKVKLLDLSPGEQITALRKGEIDVALTGQEGRLLTHDFYVRKLATLSTLAFVPTDHPLASRKQIRLSALKSEQFIGASAEDMPGYNQWVSQICRKVGFRPKFAYEGGSLAHGLELIVNENAVGIFPGYLKEHPAPGIVMLPIDGVDATWDFLVVWQRGKTAGPTRAFLDGLPSAK